MKSLPAWVPKISTSWFRRGALIAALVLFLATIPLWMPGLTSLADQFFPAPPAEPGDASEAHDDDHDHAHASKNPSITLSPSARKNIGLEVAQVRPEDFSRTITIPALVTERPGESRYSIVAPFTGIVTGMNVVAGQMVESSDLLFTLRLTHEDLVSAQKEFLETLGRLDVERAELNRLQKIDSSVMARKTLLEKQYQIETLEASLKAQRNALHLHGLDADQIERIESERMLVREMTVTVPFLHPDSSLHGPEESASNLTNASDPDHELVRQEFLVQKLEVNMGQAVETGHLLCQLADYRTLFIEGRAFEHDTHAIRNAAKNELGVQAVPEGRDAGASGLENLRIVRIANEIAPDSRALHFYVELPNEIEHKTEVGRRQFATWRFKPGQRMQLRVPIDLWKNVFVLPVEAVAQEGLETYVFVQDGKQLERRAVHVIHRDQSHAVIANDGSLFPQEFVAQNAAHQLQMAIKNQSGGAADPHAGHMH